MSEHGHKYSNALITESSPYLQQHAHNPVNWFGWNAASLKKAKSENKLLLISIGYSSCHWCHVMEKESFEDEETAFIMNEHFICIKVDREERPDVDAIYMDAVQLMTGRGGWPLNCIALPDQRPLYGGTYFTRDQWQNVLRQVAALFKNDPDQCSQYAAELTNGIKKMELVKKPVEPFDSFAPDFETIFKSFELQFDEEQGGMNRSPKFPMPSNWEFLLRYYYYSGNSKVLQHIHLTLKKMSFGGIYDHVGGGFARYSTDVFWKVPHFEKMLYDNAQLVSLYAYAFQIDKNNHYQQVVAETLSFISREMTSAEGGFYAALDADSEGIEGKFYRWTKEELQAILTKDAALFFDYYNVNELGYWEEQYYILLRDREDAEIAAKHNLSVKELHSIIAHSKSKLLSERNKRIRPGLDDKQICAWNALMLKAYIDAYSVFNDVQFLNAALTNATLIKENFLQQNRLYRIYKNGKATINAYLEDYAFTIEAFISLYQCSQDEKWLNTALILTKKVIDDFYNSENGMFYFTSKEDQPLIARKTDVQDNVIPSANSTMAKNLFILSHYFQDADFKSKAEQMVINMKDEIIKSAPWFSNWAQAALMMKNPFYEIVIAGENTNEIAKAFSKYFLPDVIFAFAKENSSIPITQNRFSRVETFIYVCVDNHCMLPVKTVNAALALLNQK